MAALRHHPMWSHPALTRRNAIHHARYHVLHRNALDTKFSQQFLRKLNK